MDQVYRPLGSGDLRVIESIAIQVAVDLLLYGVQITLSIAAITILARRLEHKRSRLTLMALLGLLSASTINTVVHKIYYLAQFPVNIGTSERSVDMLLYRLSILDSVSRDLSLVDAGSSESRISAPSPASYLFRFLELLYKQLVAHSLEPDAAPIKMLRNALAHAVSGQVLGRYGTIAEGRWAMLDVSAAASWRGTEEWWTQTTT
ncbi:hypothetical protein EV121DRAFT_285893 [Schizophyllum commune]